MGNSRSQPSRRSRPMYIICLIQRVWNGKGEQHDDKEDPTEITDRESDLSSSSRCTDCKSCHYRQDSLTFDSESEMAPNAEEELLAVKPWGPQPEKERLRPPTYNAEDYAIALRRWGRRPAVASHESQGTLPSTTSSSSGYASGSGEMTLRQFTSVSELLNKLRADLRLAFPSFVQEFASPPADGITLLLETLRGVQLIQSSPPSGQVGPRVGTRRAALDELGCVECLAACGERCPDAPRLLSQAQPGLLALAVCLTSSLNRSRVLALQLLTKVCRAPGGHMAVSEAVSTLRLRYGEGGRFRFLAGALLAPRAAMALRVAGISFLNAFLKSASRTQARLYIQAEACEAGLEPRVLQTWLTEVDVRGDDALTDLLHKEVQKWSHNCVDVEALEKRLARAEETCTMLGNKVSILQGQLDKFNNEKNVNSYKEQERKSKTKNSSSDSERKVGQHGMSSTAEDEGISSSERSSSPDLLDPSLRRLDPSKMMDNDQETTIDDVIEELRIIVKDAEEEFEDRKIQSNSLVEKIPKNKSPEKSSMNDVKRDSIRASIDLEPGKDSVTYFGRSDDEFGVNSAINKTFVSTPSKVSKITNEASVKIVVKSPDLEDAIVPAILYPQPPRRTPQCLSNILTTRETDFLENQIIYQQDDDDLEEETLDDGSDSLLSSSRLKYPKNEDPTSARDAQHFYRKSSQEIRNCGIPRESFEKRQSLPNDVSKTIRNLDNQMINSRIQSKEPDRSSRPIDVYKQFERSNVSDDDDDVTTQKRTKYKSEMEKKKSLRRASSQDVLGSSNQGRSSRVESRIRKFESLNAFENSSLQNYRNYENAERSSRLDGPKSRMKRSESFHHVSMDGRIDLSRSGGSDNGLVYITDYDLQPLVTRPINFSESHAKSTNFLTKSLEKIDEARNSMIDGTILQGKRCPTVRSIKEKSGKNASKSKDDKSKSKSGSGKNSSKKPDKNIKNDEYYNNSKLLRSDELYDGPRNERQWNFQTEVDGFRKINNYRDEAALSRHLQRNRFSDSGVFVPSGRYDAFGLGKNRFNAGKYSGHPTSTNQDQHNGIGARRNSAASLVAKRGKVTDIISGLY